MSQERLVSLPELSDRTGLPLAWLKREAEVGRIPSIKAGRRNYFDVPAVLAVIAERSRIKNAEEET